MNSPSTCGESITAEHRPSTRAEAAFHADQNGPHRLDLAGQRPAGNCVVDEGVPAVVRVGNDPVAGAVQEVVEQLGPVRKSKF